MSDYQLFALGQMHIPLVASMVAAIAYYLKAPQDSARRSLFILHSVAIFLAGTYAILVAPWSNGRAELFILPFLLLIVGFLVGLVYTLRTYSGPRDLHFLQVLQVPGAIWIGLAGTMTITHDWL